MKRREFISNCVVVLSALLFWPKSLLARTNEYREFHPRMPCGEWVEVITNTGWLNKKQEAEARQFIEQRMKEKVPDKYHGFTEIIVHGCGSSGTTVGWKYIPKKPFYPGYFTSRLSFNDGRPSSFMLQKPGEKFQAIPEETYCRIVKMKDFTFKNELGRIYL